MNWGIIALVVFQGCLLFVLGVVVGFFVKSKRVKSEDECFQETIKLWRNAVGKINDLTRRSAVQLGSVRERLVELDRSVHDERLAAPLEDLTRCCGILEKELQALKENVKGSHAATSDSQIDSSDIAEVSASLSSVQPQPSVDGTQTFGDFLTAIEHGIQENIPLRSLLDFVYEGVRNYLPCHRLGYAEIDPDTDCVRSVWCRASRACNLKVGYSAPLSKSSLRIVASVNRPRVLNDLPEYLRRHPDSFSTRLIVSEGYRSSLTLPISVDGSVVAFLFISNEQVDTFDDRMVVMARKLGEKIGQAVQATRRLKPAMA